MNCLVAAAPSAGVVAAPKVGLRTQEALVLGDRFSLSMLKDEVRAFPADRQPYHIHCVAGALWVTQENDPADHVLKAGERFLSTPHAKVVVQALSPSVVLVS